MAFNIFAFGKKEKLNEYRQPVAENAEPASAGNGAESSTNNTIKLLGRIEIYGSEPRTFVGIIEENGNEYAVYPPSQEEKLKKLQGHLIEFTVVVLDETMGHGGLLSGGKTVTPLSWEIIQ